MQAYRWIIDSRDEATEERIDKLSGNERVTECQNIGMCTVTCPKGLDPQKSLQNLLKMVGEHDLKKEAEEAL